jgi:hypothetical protein
MIWAAVRPVHSMLSSCSLGPVPDLSAGTLRTRTSATAAKISWMRSMVSWGEAGEGGEELVSKGVPGLVELNHIGDGFLCAQEKAKSVWEGECVADANRSCSDCTTANRVGNGWGVIAGADRGGGGWQGPSGRTVEEKQCRETAAVGGLVWGKYKLRHPRTVGADAG